MNSEKYYVARINRQSGRIDLQRCKCLDNSWVTPEYAKRMPHDVWQFSKRGAQNIADRYNERASRNWYKYFIIPVSNILNNEQEENK